jgi:DNA primase catalytic core
MLQPDLVALKRAHPLEAIVGQTVQLKREGKAYKGLCPFHPERTPSFFVYPDPETGGHWYCFSARCQQGGDVIAFLQRRDGLTFHQAVAYLHHLAPGNHLASGGVRQQRPRTPVDEQRRALQVAVDVYARRLWQTRGYPGRAYLTRRGITERTARAFRLGYCSGEDLADLVAELQRLHIPAQAAQDIGVIDGKTGRERFAGRITIPEIRGGQARWMTGRHLHEVSDKYLNIYGPRHILGADAVYGMAAIIGDEGPFNWLTLCQWDLPAFSFTGGSLPDEGRQWLTTARTIYLPFHRDQAGWSATCRLAPRLDGRAEIITLPQQWHGRNLNDVNDLHCAGVEPYDGYHLFKHCGRAALPWNDAFLNRDFHDLPIVLPVR